MFNKRYALLGWLTWQVGKRKAAQKAKAAVPSADEARRPKKALIVSALAAAGAAVFFWRRRGDAGEPGDASERASAD
jgi:hypothetical protein